jgi:anti-anti-sigma regulatory factor
MVSETYQKGKYQIISINEVLHLTSNITELETIIGNLLDNNALHIALRFMDGSYLCSQTGAVIVRCWEAIKDRGGTLSLINVNRDIHDFLAVIDFDSLIKIFKSEEELDSSLAD